MFESDYNRHFSYLPHNTILYSNNLINPVGALDTPDDLILKYSSTRINTVYFVYKTIQVFANAYLVCGCLLFQFKSGEISQSIGSGELNDGPHDFFREAFSK